MRWEQSGSGYANSVTWGYDDNNNLSTQKQTLNGTTYTTSYTYDKDNRLLKSAAEGKAADRSGYDSLGRLDVLVNENDSDDVLTTFIGYQDLSSSATSGQVKTWKVRPYGRTTYLYEGTYSYDARGNITAIKEADNNTRTFVYDSFDQLISEENPLFSKKWTYSYDDGGNILSKQEYVTSGQTTKLLKTTTYTYGDEDWPDLLTAYNGESITYDGIGNPLSDGTWTYTWQHGRQLSEMSRSGTDITYSYDADGLRISKTVNGTTYHYYYLDSQLVEMTWGSNKLHFTYDSVGPASVNYNGTIYNYIKNAQGDVVGLVDFNGTKVVEYIYDAWGNHLSTFGTMASTLGKYNPLRYRGYVYDTETGLYYLQSRYYNPTWGRFINADEYLSTGQSFFENNVFAYCYCSPVNLTDHTGKMAEAAACFGVFTAEEFAASLAVLGLSGPVVVWVIGIGAVLVIGAEVYAHAEEVRRSKTGTRVLADTEALNPEQAKVYQVAYVSKDGMLIKFPRHYYIMDALAILGCLSCWNNLRQATTYNEEGPTCEAKKYAMSNGSDYWGIYTPLQAHAKHLALLVHAKEQTVKSPEVHGPGMYGHYHDGNHAFHIWYGGPLYY